MLISEIERAEFLSDRVTYDHTSGDIIWKYSKDNGEYWNRRYAGKKAGSIQKDKSIHIGVTINSKVVFILAHRLAWFMYYGELPKKYIDHIDHDRMNNKIDNLRDVSQLENSQNMSLPIKNKSGHIGVIWHKRDKKWNAQIKADGKIKHLGSFNNLSDAIVSRKNAERKYGFHENHGALK